MCSKSQQTQLILKVDTRAHLKSPCCSTVVDQGWIGFMRRRFVKLVLALFGLLMQISPQQSRFSDRFRQKRLYWLVAIFGALSIEVPSTCRT
jgi:hypothetical protein